MDNPYYDPEKFGLRTVGEIEWSEPNYNFDLTVLWRDGVGRLYWGDDSGCSCPAPFEDVRSLDDLTAGSFHEFANHANKRLQEERDSGYGTPGYAAPQMVELLTKALS
jgi:hypothetical protein